MQSKYLGDSYDIVKRFWGEKLAGIGRLHAHPRFVPLNIREAFEHTVGIPVLPEEARPDHDFGVFMDPDTGIPLPTAAKQTASVSHCPVSFIRAEMDRLQPRYVVVFDQSHDRNCGLAKPQQREAKLVALRQSGIYAVYYVSHAPFLFGATDPSVVSAIQTALVASGIPEWRFEMSGAEVAS